MGTHSGQGDSARTARATLAPCPGVVSSASGNSAATEQGPGARPPATVPRPGPGRLRPDGRLPLGKRWRPDSSGSRGVTDTPFRLYSPSTGGGRHPGAWPQVSSIAWPEVGLDVRVFIVPGRSFTSTRRRGPGARSQSTPRRPDSSLWLRSFSPFEGSLDRPTCTEALQRQTTAASCRGQTGLGTGGDDQRVVSPRRRKRCLDRGDRAPRVDTPASILHQEPVARKQEPQPRNRRIEEQAF